MNFKEVCFEMLTQRGYDITEEDEIIIAVSKTDRIIVFTNDSAKLTIENIKYYTSIMNDFKFNHAIIIYGGVITSQANKTISALTEFDIELFNKKSLAYNITRHRLVPSHRKLEMCEVVDFKSKYGVKIPVILKSDPVARFYNFKQGDIIEIKRKEGTIFYRIVK